jgi:hypothetical protein
MSVRMLVLSVGVLGAVGQLACSAEAETAPSCSTGTSSDPASFSCEGEEKFCGGIANFQCPEGLQCVDDPSDTCVPEEGGADCSGICVCEDTDPRKP